MCVDFARTCRAQAHGLHVHTGMCACRWLLVCARTRVRVCGRVCTVCVCARACVRARMRACVCMLACGCMSLCVQVVVTTTISFSLSHKSFSNSAATRSRCIFHCKKSKKKRKSLRGRQDRCTHTFLLAGALLWDECSRYRDLQARFHRHPKGIFGVSASAAIR